MAPLQHHRSARDRDLTGAVLMSRHAEAVCTGVRMATMTAIGLRFYPYGHLKPDEY